MKATIYGNEVLTLRKEMKIYYFKFGNNRNCLQAYNLMQKLKEEVTTQQYNTAYI